DEVLGTVSRNVPHAIGRGPRDGRLRCTAVHDVPVSLELGIELPHSVAAGHEQPRVLATLGPPVVSGRRRRDAPAIEEIVSNAIGVYLDHLAGELGIGFGIESKWSAQVADHNTHPVEELARIGPPVPAIRGTHYEVAVAVLVGVERYARNRVHVAVAPRND